MLAVPALLISVMCLIVFAWRQHPSLDFLLAANRDEFHARPTEAAHWWTSPGEMFGGRDIKAGGAWCAAGRDGRFAAVTNVREPSAPAGRYSRGVLVRDYLVGSCNAGEWAHRMHSAGEDFSPFNLLVGDPDSLWFVSNRGTRPCFELAPGVHAISNGHWGERWPKTERAESRLRGVLKADHAIDQALDNGRQDLTDALFELLADRDAAPPGQLPNTGVPSEQEEFLSPIFIHGATYGTRASTVMARSANDRMTFYERGFDADASVAHRIEQSWIQEQDAQKDGST